MNRLNDTLKYVCILCTKLCFREQGFIISENCQNLYIPFLTGQENVDPFLLRRELLKYLRIYQIEGIPPKVLERAHLKHSNRSASKE